MTNTPIPFCSFGGYRRFSRWWWRDLGRWLSRGWWKDLSAYWHRARYGWAARDTWNLEHYLAHVYAGSLAHLAHHSCGTPAGYPNRVADADTQKTNTDFDTPETDHQAWTDALLRWSQAFADYARDDYFELYYDDYVAWNADEQRRSEALHEALREMEPWFEALWD